MKVIVNMPDDIKNLESAIIDFHKTLILEKINNLEVTDEDKKKVFKMILKKLATKNKKINPFV